MMTKDVQHNSMVGGCASKLESAALSRILRSLNFTASPDVILGLRELDDAAILKGTGADGIVVSVDFMTPVVKSPIDFGEIAAAHCLSDVYAKGGRPIAALALAGIPGSGDYIGSFSDIMKGAQSKLTYEGVVLVGGHSMRNDVPFFGLVVIGNIDPCKIWRKAGARPGDNVILTKPLGNGAIFAAMVQNRVSHECSLQCVRIAKETNAIASHTLSSFSVHAATDVTGYGLALQAIDVAKASEVTVRLRMSLLPILDAFHQATNDGFTTNITGENRQGALKELNVILDAAGPTQGNILFDPQTSGGLLVALPAAEAPAALDMLSKAGVENCAIVGEVLQKSGHTYLQIAD